MNSKPDLTNSTPSLVFRSWTRSIKVSPFFLIRIPGLGQPRVQEIIAREHLDADNEAQLLKRFGEKSIANPFTLQADSPVAA